MFKNSYQSGFLSIFYSIGSKPLESWEIVCSDGHIKRQTDEDLESNVLELVGANVSTTYIKCPGPKFQTLGIKLPFLVLIIKSINRYFCFEVQILDDKYIKRRFKASNFQKTTKVSDFICSMPMQMDNGWNQIQFNLPDFTKRAYGTNYLETLQVKVHCNCRIRRIYFADKIYANKDLPPAFKLYKPRPRHKMDTNQYGNEEGMSN